VVTRIAYDALGQVTVRGNIRSLISNKCARRLVLVRFPSVCTRASPRWVWICPTCVDKGKKYSRHHVTATAKIGLRAHGRIIAVRTVGACMFLRTCGIRWVEILCIYITRFTTGPLACVRCCRQQVAAKCRRVIIVRRIGRNCDFKW